MERFETIPYLEPVEARPVKLTAPEFRHVNIAEPLRSFINSICPAQDEESEMERARRQR